jgi:lambda family phage portal protein
MMTAKITLIDTLGNPIAPTPARRRPLAMEGSSHPYQAADWHTAEMANWSAAILSPDLEINPARDLIVSRVRDLVRNDGWASGAVSTLCDTVIGGAFRLMSKPDWRALRLFSPAFDATWADEFGRAVEALWRPFAYDINRYNDVERRLTFAQQSRLAFRHRLVDGESLAISHWRPDRVELGAADYATCLQVIDPDRLSNPWLIFDQKYMRGGVEVDLDGAPVAYTIREAHPADWYDAARAMTWKRIARETSWGRRIVIHDFDQERAGQHRAAGGIFTPIVARLRMLAKYDATELQAAVVNAIFAAYVESPFDADDVQASLGGTGEGSAYQQERVRFHDDKRLTINGVRMATLFPGEKLNTVAPTRPAGNFDAFEAAVLRNVASAFGMSFEQLSRDWSKSNYSSARGALVEAWKTTMRRRDDHAAGFCTPFFAGWLEEAFDRRDLPLPNDAPIFQEARTAYAACRWAGTARGWVDPLREKQGAVLSMRAGLSTLEQELFDQGIDWEEQLEQMAIEKKRRAELDLDESAAVDLRGNVSGVAAAPADDGNN